MTWKICSSQKYAAGGTAWEIDINTAGTFTLLSSGTVDVDVYWGDGDVETVTTNSVDHTYPAAGTYTIGIKINSGDFRPYYNSDAAADELVTLGDTPAGWSFGAILLDAFHGSANLTTVGDIDTSAVTNFGGAWISCTSLTSFSLLNTSNGGNFGYTWYNCSSLTSFPLIDTSSGTNFSNAWYNCSSLTLFPPINTSSGTTFASAWYNCSSLTSFPLLNTSNGTNFSTAWYNCSGLTSFPLIDTSSGVDFFQAWRNCSSLDNITTLGEQYSFPLIDISSGTNFSTAWYNCSSMTEFPPNFFDSWIGTPVANCFSNTWKLCSSLTATSVENILNSIDTSGQNAQVAGPNITIDYNASSGTPNITTAVTNLKARNWTINLNGVAQ